MYFRLSQCVRPTLINEYEWMKMNESLWTQYVTNCVGEFHQIYNLAAVGDKDKLIRVWGQKVKGQGHSMTRYRCINSLELIFLPTIISRLHRCILMKLATATHYQVRMTLATFRRSWVQRLMSRTTFPMETYQLIFSRGRPYSCNFIFLSCSVVFIISTFIFFCGSVRTNCR